LATYPTLSVNPDTRGWKEGPITDPTIRTKMESGIIVTRARFTTVPWFWSFSYSLLPNTDKVTLMTFFKTTVKFGAVAFDWTNPLDSVVYSVKFGAVVEPELEDSQQKEWSVDVLLVEALATD